MPVAADTKFCTVSASAATRWLIVVSPPYACQLVLVAKLTAAFHATGAGTAGRSLGLPGRLPCRRCSRYTTTTPARLNTTTAVA